MKRDNKRDNIFKVYEIFEKWGQIREGKFIMSKAIIHRTTGGRMLRGLFILFLISLVFLPIQSFAYQEYEVLVDNSRENLMKLSYALVQIKNVGKKRNPRCKGSDSKCSFNAIDFEIVEHISGKPIPEESLRGIHYCTPTKIDPGCYYGCYFCKGQGEIIGDYYIINVRWQGEEASVYCRVSFEAYSSKNYFIVPFPVKDKDDENYKRFKDLLQIFKKDTELTNEDKEEVDRLISEISQNIYYKKVKRAPLSFKERIEAEVYPIRLGKREITLFIFIIFLIIFAIGIIYNKRK